MEMENKSEGSKSDWKKQKKGSSINILTIFVLFVGLVALAGLMVGVFVWLETAKDKTSDNDMTGGGGTPKTQAPAKGSMTRDPPSMPGEPELAPTSTVPEEEVCETRRTSTACSSDACSFKYRTYDGTCNNQKNTLWGASEIPFKRLLGPIYEDGLNSPVGWDPYKRYSGYLKPNPRLVSQEIMSTPMITKNVRFTDLVMVWGLHIVQDITLRSRTDSLCTEPCTQSSPYCFPILAPDNDPRLAKGDCIPLTRTTRVCDLDSRHQLNTITSYIDANSKYGSTPDRALALRKQDGSGHLREGVSVDAYGKVSKSLLPFVTGDFVQFCDRPLKDKSGVPCFFSGDARANLLLGTTALHTVWNREHNRIADELKEINPQWNGETLYQEARKIVGALHQMITFEHWLPNIVGTKGMELLGAYTGYDDTVDVSAANSFATATFRFGHALISPNVVRLGPDFQEAPNGNLLLRDNHFCPAKVVNEGSIDPILRGMFGTPLKDINPQNLISSEVTEHLFEASKTVAHDLASRNIQRGRDHGLPGYNAWRRFCNLPVANTFNDLAGEISDASLRQKLENLYGHPDNVDLFVAGLVEDPWHDSLVGPTFTCLIVEQFGRLRDGDRFWYENPGVFTPDQLIQLKKYTLARAFCNSGDDVQDVQPDVFKRGTSPNGYKTCDDISGMDLTTAWMDSGNGNC